MYVNSTTFISACCIPSTVLGTEIQTVPLFSDFYGLCSEGVTSLINK